MKRAWNLLWILLTAAVTAAGFFLPRLALSRQGAPNFAMNYQTALYILLVWVANSTGIWLMSASPVRILTAILPVV